MHSLFNYRLNSTSTLCVCASLCCSGIIAGLCDGSVQVYSVASLVATSSRAPAATLTFNAHAGSVNCVHAMKLTSGSAGCATGGDDGLVRLWQVPFSDAMSSRGRRQKAAAALEPCAVLSGSEAMPLNTLSALMIDAAGRLVVAGDSAGSIAVWSASALHPDNVAAEEPSAAPLKRARLASSDNTAVSVGTSVPQVAPLSFLPSSDGRLTGVAWLSGGASVASASMSGRITLHDVETALAATTVLSAPKSCLAISTSPFGSLFATAHTDRCVRVWDPRVASGGGSDGARSILRFTDDSASSSWVSSVAWHPVSSNLVASGSFNGLVALWDIRATGAPLFNVHSHTRDDGAIAKVLCVAWSGAEGSVLASGGDDARLRTSTVKGDLPVA